MEQDDLVSVGVICKRLGIPQYAVYRLVKSGKIKAYEYPREIWHQRRKLGFRLADVARALGLDPLPD